ncbi:putative membrane protein YqjE [Catenulispora sp. GP43]|uniref:phage holin family protein n=1 Tax=Catenulispora sp. GP43 TaxID=3156263 RepID=UPI003514D501
MATERIMSPAQPSTAELMNDAAAQISRLVHDEITLARLEMQTKVRQMGFAAGLMASAMLLARIGLLLAWALVVVALANVWPLWLAVAVPMAGAFVLAGGAALLGRRRLATATPPVPTEASESVRTDLRLAQDAVHEGRKS